MNGAISSIRILPAEVDAAWPARESSSSQSGFHDALDSAIEDIDHLGAQAQDKISQVLSGNGADVHSALIAVEKADLSFQLMMQVRNKIVSAYEEISRMQF
jgi:flagellar hook-basal body complex protein FliE